MIKNLIKMTKLDKIDEFGLVFNENFLILSTLKGFNGFQGYF